MTKRDLKTGMVVECKNGKVFQVFLGTTKNNSGKSNILVGVNNDYWTDLDVVDDDLTTPWSDDYTIIKVYDYTFCWHLTNPQNYENWECKWERKEVKELTVAEIEKLLGYPVKIVKE